VKTKLVFFHRKKVIRDFLIKFLNTKPILFCRRNVVAFTGVTLITTLGLIYLANENNVLIASEFPKYGGAFYEQLLKRTALGLSRTIEQRSFLQLNLASELELLILSKANIPLVVNKFSKFSKGILELRSKNFLAKDPNTLAAELYLMSIILNARMDYPILGFRVRK